MNKLYISFLLIFINNIVVTAQNGDYSFQNDEKIEHFTEGYVKQFEKQLLPRAVVKIPVVVHIVWKNTDENISDAQIRSQIDVLNQDFRKKNIDAKDVPGSFKTVAADCEIEFCLAQRDTLGASTTGITRRQTTADNIGTAFLNNRRRIYYQDLGGVQNWKPQQYLNIWVCKMDNILGYNTSLSKAMANPNEDGVVVDYRVFGTTGTAAQTEGHKKGRTATHEIGHYFNLLHIWGTDNTCNDDDLVDDTPKQDSAYLGCPSFPQLSCGIGNMFMNFMDYTNDECMGLFSVGQKARMWATLTAFRSGLLNNLPCETTPINNLENVKRLNIYPNPSSGLFTMEWLLDKTSWVNIQVKNGMGQIVYKNLPLVLATSTTELIDLSNQPSGLYILEVLIDDKLIIRKLVKN